MSAITEGKGGGGGGGGAAAADEEEEEEENEKGGGRGEGGGGLHVPEKTIDVTNNHEVRWSQLGRGVDIASMLDELDVCVKETTCTASTAEDTDVNPVTG